LFCEDFRICVEDDEDLRIRVELVYKGFYDEDNGFLGVLLSKGWVLLWDMSFWS
jgi:hypothetical protein